MLIKYNGLVSDLRRLTKVGTVLSYNSIKDQNMSKISRPFSIILD